MGFLLGLLMGLLAAIGLFGFLTYWLCSRSNNVAVAKFINGIALALAYKPNTPRPLTPDTPAKNGEAKAEPAGMRKEKPKEQNRP